MQIYFIRLLSRYRKFELIYFFVFTGTYYKSYNNLYFYFLHCSEVARFAYDRAKNLHLMAIIHALILVDKKTSMAGASVFRIQFFEFSL